MRKIFLYGPPGSGKSTIGRCLAAALALPCYDLDEEIEADSGSSISEIFAKQGEASFREREKKALDGFLESPGGFVLGLGAGALLDEESRRKTEAVGKVVLLRAEQEILLERMRAEADLRPLLKGDLSERLGMLLSARAEHYGSFRALVDTSRLTTKEAAWQAQIKAGFFRVEGMGEPYPVLILDTELEGVGSLLKEFPWKGSAALVCDENTARHYEARMLEVLGQAGIGCQPVRLAAGEAAKNLQSAAGLWEAFLRAGLDRKSCVLALGGGVVTDLAGFAAATYLRGVNWAAFPSTLLGMVDASLGGKTGLDLPQGKNLVGAFHAPRLVAAWVQTLATLPEAELRNGMAEIVKHAIIADPDLFEDCARGGQAFFHTDGGVNWGEFIARAAAVKIRVLLEDPFEQGRRAVLNFGHTIGHALEQASGYLLRHGEAVAVGMAVEARIGEAVGITEKGTAGRIGEVLEGLGLPTQVPGGLDPGLIRSYMKVDKKNRAGRARLALPLRIGEIIESYEIEEEKLWSLFWSCMGPT